MEGANSSIVLISHPGITSNDLLLIPLTTKDLPIRFLREYLGHADTGVQYSHTADPRDSRLKLANLDEAPVRPCEGFGNDLGTVLRSEGSHSPCRIHPACHFSLQHYVQGVMKVPPGTKLRARL